MRRYLWIAKEMLQWLWYMLFPTLIEVPCDHKDKDGQPRRKLMMVVKRRDIMRVCRETNQEQQCQANVGMYECLDCGERFYVLDMNSVQVVSSD